MDSGHATMIEAGVSFDWASLPPLVQALDGVRPDVEELNFLRQEKSHRSLSRFKRLKRLWAAKANQEMIDEIGELPYLEVLRIKGVTATSLAPLSTNRKLKRLILSGCKVSGFEWARDLSPTLEVLHLESFFQATDIDPLATLSQLRTLGLEGGMDRKLELDSLAPLATLTNLQYLFLAATRVADKSLAPLQGLKKLSHLTCGAYFPDAEFVALGKALPGLDCGWIEMIKKHGSIRAGLARR